VHARQMWLDVSVAIRLEQSVDVKALELAI
jgi:hypothetical protein